MTSNRERLLIRITIDREGGVGVEDCARASELLDKIYEKDGLMRGSYTLEVMSPGVDRPLKDARDFKRFEGKEIRVQLKEPLEGSNRLEGKIVSAEEEGFVLDCEGERVKLGYGVLSKANLKPELPW